MEEMYRKLIDKAVERGSLTGLRAALNLLQTRDKDEALRILTRLIAEQENNENRSGTGRNQS